MLVVPPEQLQNLYERLGRRIRFEGNPIASRFVGLCALHGIELIEWVDPAPEPREPSGQHAVGVSRIALRCKQLGPLVERLEAEGIVFETPPQQIDIVGAKGFVLFRDPDGVLLELIEL